MMRGGKTVLCHDAYDVSLNPPFISSAQALLFVSIMGTLTYILCSPSFAKKILSPIII